MVPDELPFLYQITLGKCLERTTIAAKNSAKCKRCNDTGSYTVADDVKRKGMLDLCQFCTSTQVILHGRYQIVKQVGEGNFSVVYLAQDLLAPTSAAVALKIFHQQYEEIGLEEVKCLKEARSSDRQGAFGSLKFLHALRHNRKHVVIVTESLMATDLFERATTPGTAQINNASAQCPLYIAQLIYNLALNLYLFHENLKRIHGDIKPENVLLSRTDRRFKLIDYGSSVPFDSLKHYEEDYEVVSWLYRAPELLVGVPFGAGVDIWALGSVIFEACAKRPLSASLDRAERIQELSDLLGPYPDSYLRGKMISPDFEIPSISAFDEQDHAWWRRWRAANFIPYVGYKDAQFLDLLSGMLDPDMNTRLSILEILEHPFLAAFVPFKPTVTAEKMVETENQKPSVEKNTIKAQRKSAVDAEIETVLLNMTPLKAPVKRGLGPTRKVPAVTGKRRARPT